MVRIGFCSKNSDDTPHMDASEAQAVSVLMTGTFTSCLNMLTLGS